MILIFVLQSAESLKCLTIETLFMILSSHDFLLIHPLSLGGCSLTGIGGGYILTAKGKKR